MSKLFDLFDWAKRPKPEPVAVSKPETPTPTVKECLTVAEPQEPRTQEGEATVPTLGRRRQQPKIERGTTPCPSCSLFGWVVGGTDLKPLAVPCGACGGEGRI